MSESMLTIVKVIVVGVALVNFVGAGKHHHHHKSNIPETYDQSQKGDYNIRIHLKDFQIVALLNDGLGDLGDYDYNYDYSDLTVKPLLPSFTTSSPSTTTPKATTEKLSSSEPTPIEAADAQNASIPVENPTSAPLTSSEPPKSAEEQKTTTLAPDSDIIFLNNQTNLVDNETLIAVQVLYDALNSNNLIKKLPTKPQENEIVDEKPVVENADNAFLTEDDPLKPKRRRCANGFRRDKNGRCRILRRPGGYPFEAQLSRLASRIRQGTKQPPQATA